MGQACCGETRFFCGSIFGVLPLVGVIDGFVWVGTRLYGPTCDVTRQNLWVELRDIRQQWVHPWCVFGDFNVIRFPSERLGCRRLSPPMLEFSDFIEDLNLVDLPLGGGGRFTWSCRSEKSVYV